MGDSADKHTEMEEAHKKMLKAHGETKGQTDAAHQKAQDLYDKLAAHATMPERVEYLETMIGEGANNHKKHKASVEERLEFVEKSIGDSAEQHAKHDEVVDGLHKALKELDGKHKGRITQHVSTVAVTLMSRFTLLSVKYPKPVREPPLGYETIPPG